MLELPGVTLCCVDTANHALALEALERSRVGVRFARTLFLTSGFPSDRSPPPDIEIVVIAPIAGREAYSQFVLKGLLPHVATPHVLLVQWDGFVVNPDAWEQSFLDCDYIGARWFWHNDHMRVGNGGFSLRSQRLLAALQDSRIVLRGPEDETIGRAFRPLLETEYGIRFASDAQADRFAFEAAHPIGKPFGFHGLFNFCRVMSADDIARLAAGFSDAITRSLQAKSLLRNCVALGQWSAVAALARRMLQAEPGDAAARATLGHAEEAIARGPVVGRNEPCPCGSGKRYKHCHGAPGAPSISAATATPTADTLVARAIEAHKQGQLDAAERDYRTVLEATPDHPHALHFLGVILYQRERFAEALPLLERAAARIPNEPEFHNNLGLALAAVDRTDEAVVAYRRAISLKREHAVAWNNLGLALQASNRLPESIEAFRSALEIAPQFAHAHWNLGLALLAHGDFAEGWREYDWRLAITELGGRIAPPPAPRWDGTNPAGKTLLLTSEQGFGDTLQFIRFAPLLAARGARVVVQTQPPLMKLLARVRGVSAIASSEEPPPACDAHLPLLSLGRALAVDASSIPGHVPYLAADPAQVAAVADALAPYRATFNIGLSWAGRRAHGNDRRRSCPLAVLATLFDLPGVTWFSLQRDDGEDQIAGVPDARAMILLEARRDFDGKAALIDALDLVISVDTSNAHLAGALARPLWVLLPFAPDWRWQLDRTDSPWYPTARLFRQEEPGGWDRVVAHVRSALASELAKRR